MENKQVSKISELPKKITKVLKPLSSECLKIDKKIIHRSCYEEDLKPVVKSPVLQYFGFRIYLKNTSTFSVWQFRNRNDAAVVMASFEGNDYLLLGNLNLRG